VRLVGTMETMHAAGRRSLPPVPRAITERPAPQADRPAPDGRDPETPTERFVVDLATGEQRTVSTVDAAEDAAAEVSAPVAIAAGDDDPTDEPDGAELVEDEAAAEDAPADEAPQGGAPQGEAPEGDFPEDETPVDETPEDETPEDETPEGALQDDVAEDDAPALDAAADTQDDAEPAAQDQPRAEAVDLDPAQEYVARLRAAAADFAEAAGAESAVVREAVPPARHRRARCRLVLRYADESEVDVTFLGPAGRPGTPSRHGFDRQIRRWLADGQHREDAWLVDDEDASDGLAVDLSAWVAAA